MPFDEILNENTDITLTAAASPVFCSNGSGMTDKALAMVYSPYQSWEDLFSEDEALKKGTLFAQLYKPYIGGNKPR